MTRAASFERLRRRCRAQEDRREVARPADPAGRQNLFPALPAVFLISLSILVFEIALTRVFSVMLSYHFVFAIISAAMLGLGAGGFIYARMRGGTRPGATWAGAFAYAVTIVVAVLLILTLPLGSFAALSGVRTWVYIALALAPFCAAGFALAGLFRSLPERGSLLYGADLVGAALGALAVVPAMDAWGGVNVTFLAAAVAASDALVLGLLRRRHFTASLVALILFAGLFAAFARTGNGVPVPILPDPNKEMQGVLAEPGLEARVVESRWSSFGRTDLVASDLDPREKTIFVDGAAGSAMLDLDALKRDREARMALQLHSGESLPLQVLKPRQKRSALILGPGGGKDVDIAVLAGVRQITAVEVNPDVVALVRQYRGFNGGIYSGRPGVDVVIGDAREYARTSERKYDLIMAAIPVTKSSRSVDGYALTENGLFTRESLRDYLDHLTPGGRLVFVAHNEVEIYKLIGLALAAYQDQGVPETEAMRRIYTVGAEMMPAVVVQKNPVTRREANVLHYELHRLGLDAGALFIPGIAQKTRGTLRMLDQGLVGIASGATTFEAVSAQAPYDLRVATNDRPFFYKYERGLPDTFRPFLIAMAAAVAALAVILLLPRGRVRQGSGFIGSVRGDPRLKLYLLGFTALGVGFMLIEIAFFQKLSPFISRPQTALTVLLFSLLLGGGIGSALTALLTSAGRQVAAVALPAAAAALTVVLVFVFPRAFELGLDPRLAAALLVLPLGVLLGCPFPLALRALTADGLEQHMPVFWGVNGAAAVLGSATAMMIGVTWGFSVALFAGAAFYAGVGAVFGVQWAWRRAALLAEQANEEPVASSQLPQTPFIPSPSGVGTLDSHAGGRH